jgi:hypothetical protein
MDDVLHKLHDATLLSINFDWEARSCEMSFAGGPAFPDSFSICFSDVSQLHVPAEMPWGPSVSVLEVSITQDNRFAFAMQSGDTVTLVAPNYSFKRTPLRGAS